jgi:hypothetical protein
VSVVAGMPRTVKNPMSFKRPRRPNDVTTMSKHQRSSVGDNV